MKSKLKNARLVALDLDGTVLRSDNTLSPAMRSALESLIKSGVEVAVASGRPFGTIHPDIMKIEGLRYLITSNGAAVYESGKRVFSRTMDGGDVAALMKLTEPYDLIWEAFRDGEIYTDSRYYSDPVRYGCGEAYIEYVRSSRGHRSDMRNYIIENRNRLDEVEFVCTDDRLRNYLWDEIAAKLTNLHITSSSRNFVELMDKKATKSNGLRWLCERLGIDLRDTAAAGNADNDVDMLKAAGIGIAVKNASEKCLAAADIIVAANDEDGLAEVFPV